MNIGQDRQMQMVRGNGGNQFRQYAGQNAGNPTGYNDVIGNQVIQNAVQNPRARAEGNAAGQNGNQIRCYNCRGVGHYDRNCTVKLKRRDAAYLQTQLLIAQKEEARIQLQAEEYDLMAAAVDLDEIKEVNANCILMANLQMTIETHNWASSAHQELHKIIREEIFPIVNQVDARLQNFEVQFLKEAAKFVGDFKSLTNKGDASFAKHKALELEIERLLKAVVSQDIMIIVQNKSVVDTSDL
nr:hypothetical protein [Tanacetum cinerariifolium]